MEDGAGFDLRVGRWQHGIGIVRMKERIRLVRENSRFVLTKEEGRLTHAAAFSRYSTGLQRFTTVRFQLICGERNSSERHHGTSPLRGKQSIAGAITLLADLP